MKVNQFLIKLGTVTLLTVMLVLGLNFHPDVGIAQSLSWATISFFVVLSLLIYFVGSLTAKQENKNNYTSLVLLVMINKMFLCILLVAIYVKTSEPTSNFFLIPFFCIYLIYTIFEVYIMTRLGKND